MAIEKIRTYVEDIIKNEDELFLVDIVLKGNSGNQKLIVLIDGDTGVDIDKCAEISRKLGNFVEEEELMDGKYFLEVSSPGLDMPLKLHRQYQKNIGRFLKVEFIDGKKVKGKLNSVLENSILLEEEKTQKNLDIDFKEINRTFVEVSFK